MCQAVAVLLPFAFYCMLVPVATASTMMDLGTIRA